METRFAQPAEGDPERIEPKRPAGRELLTGGAHLAGLWAIAMAQPLLDLLGSNPEFFIARGNTAADILILAIGFTLIPPLVLLGFEALVRLIAGPTAYLAVHLSLITLLAAVFVVQIEKRLFEEPTALIIALALALGALLAYGLMRLRFVRGLLDVLAIAPVVFLVAFIFFSGVSKLILPQDEAEALGGVVESDTPVVMVIFDELPGATLMTPRGTIDQRRFPGFAALAREGTYYPNNSTVADFTARAVPPIMTGIRTTGRELPIAADQPQSIFTLLGEAYRFNVEESITELCPDSLCGSEDDAERDDLVTRLRALVDDLKYVEGRLVLPPGLADKLPNVTTTFGDFGVDEDLPANKRAAEYARDLFSPPSPGELEAWVDEIPAGGRTLSLIHMELPHEPFQFLPDGRIYNSTDLSNLNSPSSQRWAVGPAGIASVEQRHYLQTAYADRLVQSLISRMKEVGIWDEAMVVVTSDHGLSFKPLELRRIVNQGNLGGVANPPLFIKQPGQRRGRTSPKPTRTVDVVPTVAETLGIEDLYETDGMPISELGPNERTTVEVEDATGEMVTAPLAQMLRQRDQVIETSRERLGSGGIWALGPEPGLLGQEVGEATSGELAELDQPDLLGDLSPDMEPVRTFITGELDRGVDPNVVIAIAINGRIAATTRAFIYEDEHRFGAVVPPQALTTGYNPVGIYRLTATGDLELLGGA